MLNLRSLLTVGLLTSAFISQAQADEMISQELYLPDLQRIALTTLTSDNGLADMGNITSIKIVNSDAQYVDQGHGIAAQATFAVESRRFDSNFPICRAVVKAYLSKRNGQFSSFQTSSQVDVVERLSCSAN